MGTGASLQAAVEEELGEQSNGSYTMLDALTAAKAEIAQLRAKVKEQKGGLVARPAGAVGPFLRIATVNDVYKIQSYPRLCKFLRVLRETSDCKVISTMSGDFLSPCVLSSLDGGKAMGEVLDTVPIDYVSFGNHEFDCGIDRLQQRTQAYHGVWLNGNIHKPDFVDPTGAPLPEYQVVKVGDRSVLLSGFTTNNPDIYRPGCDPTIEDPTSAMLRVWKKACEQLSKVPDAFVPMTHQTIEEDRASAEFLNLVKDCDPKPRVPLILGGHEHEVYIESVHDTLVVKVGQDAENVGIIDVWWDEQGRMFRSCQLLPLDGFVADRDGPCAAFVAKQERFMNEVLSTEIARIPEAGWSTKRVRFEPSRMASFLLTKVKAALKVDIAIVQGGCVRGKSEYEAGAFTYEMLMREFAFETEMAVVQLPGNILADSIANTRSSPDKEMPNFLHCDFDCDFDAANLTHIDKQPLDRDKLYNVAILQFLLRGMNPTEPLLTYVRDNVDVPDVERCFPAKILVMEQCVKEAWARIVDAHGGDVDKTFNAVDHDGSGTIDPHELAAYVNALAADDDPSNDVPVALVAKMIEFLDTDSDGKITLREFHTICKCR